MSEHTLMDGFVVAARVADGGPTVPSHQDRCDRCQEAVWVPDGETPRTCQGCGGAMVLMCVTCALADDEVRKIIGEDGIARLELGWF